MCENLEFAKRHCGGQFSVILAKAEDMEATPRRIKECWPSSMRMKIRSFDPATGSLEAVAIEI